MSSLSPAHTQTVLAHLNEIAPDTFDEGSFGRWTFTSLRRDADTWALAFTNTGAVDGDLTTFHFAGDCVDADGRVSDAWFEAVNTAVLDWESEMSDGGDGGDDGGGDED